MKHHIKRIPHRSQNDHDYNQINFYNYQKFEKMIIIFCNLIKKKNVKILFISFKSVFEIDFFEKIKHI